MQSRYMARFEVIVAMMGCDSRGYGLLTSLMSTCYWRIGGWKATDGVRGSHSTVNTEANHTRNGRVVKFEVVLGRRRLNMKSNFVNGARPFRFHHAEKTFA